MRLPIVRTLGLFVIVAGIASRSYAASIITVPAGLTPGEQYRLVFVTADEYTISSTILAVYNAEVNNEANAAGSPLAALGATWLDIGSTASVNAIDNVGQDPGVPIYNLDGQLVADDATTGPGGLFSGSIFNPIDYSESGEISIVGLGAWTGSSPDGTANSAGGGYGIGLGAFYQTFGDPTATGATWIDLAGSYSFNSNSFYGISGILTAPDSSAPEPSTTVMMSLGGLILLFAFKRRRGLQVDGYRLKADRIR